MRVGERPDRRVASARDNGLWCLEGWKGRTEGRGRGPRARAKEGHGAGCGGECGGAAETEEVWLASPVMIICLAEGRRFARSGKEGGGRRRTEGGAQAVPLGAAAVRRRHWEVEMEVERVGRRRQGSQGRGSCGDRIAEVMECRCEERRVMIAEWADARRRSADAEWSAKSGAPRGRSV